MSVHWQFQDFWRQAALLEDASAQDDITEQAPSPLVRIHTHNPSEPPYSHAFSVVYLEQVAYTTHPIPLSTHLAILEQLS